MFALAVSGENLWLKHHGQSLGIDTIQGMSGGIWKYVEMFQGFMGDPAQQKSTAKVKHEAFMLQLLASGDPASGSVIYSLWRCILLDSLWRKYWQPIFYVWFVLQLKAKMEKKLKSYKESLEKVAGMIKDNVKTTFVAVCIAEYLSISETQRLLLELNGHNVHSNHIIVNQLLDKQVRKYELKSSERIVYITDSSAAHKKHCSIFSKRLRHFMYPT